MKGKKLKRGLALVLGLMLAAEVPASVATPFQMFDSYAYTGAATVKATSLNVRSGAGTGYSSVGRRERQLPLSGNSAEQTAIHGIRFNTQERAEP